MWNAISVVLDLNSCHRFFFNDNFYAKYASPLCLSENRWRSDILLWLPSYHFLFFSGLSNYQHSDFLSGNFFFLFQLFLFCLIHFRFSFFFYLYLESPTVLDTWQVVGRLNGYLCCRYFRLVVYWGDLQSLDFQWKQMLWKVNEYSNKSNDLKNGHIATRLIFFFFFASSKKNKRRELSLWYQFSLKHRRQQQQQQQQQQQHKNIIIFYADDGSDDGSDVKIREKEPPVDEHTTSNNCTFIITDYILL